MIGYAAEMNSFRGMEPSPEKSAYRNVAGTIFPQRFVLSWPEIILKFHILVAFVQKVKKAVGNLDLIYANPIQISFLRGN